MIKYVRDYDGDPERAAEAELIREYRDIAGQFRYAIETERRFYLANEVKLQEKPTLNGIMLQVELSDVWVWDIYRPDRFVKSAKIMTFRDVNVEELNSRDISLPDELAIED